MKQFSVCFFLFLSFISGFSQRAAKKTLQDPLFYTGDLVSLPKLYFVLGKCNLMPEGMDSLRLISVFLNTHPDLYAEIQTHTDYENPASSMHLTMCRACACRDSLVKLGIDPGRLSCKGFGEKRPFVCREELVLPSGKKVAAGTVVNKAYWSKFKSQPADCDFLRSLNRRTEMEIKSAATDTSLKSNVQPLELKGKYNGKNIYFLDPDRTNGGGGTVCTGKVLVNGKKILLRKGPGQEIRLDSLGLKIGDSVRVQIFHRADCLPKLLNDVYEAKQKLNLLDFRLDSTGLLTWQTQAETGSYTYQIEQFLWNKWVKIGEVKSMESLADTVYTFQTLPHSGENKVRLKQVDYAGSGLVSGVLLGKSGRENRKVVVLNLYVQNKIEFSAETMYELYDMYGNLLQKGFGKYIPCADLGKGMYYLNFDNQTTEVYKR